DKIVELVHDAQVNKASGERISQWFGQKYTFLVVGAFLVSLGLRYFAFHTPFGSALLTSLTLLVALSPCALVISTPASTLSALTWAARHGILVRGGSFVEASGRIDTVVIDKTGTLTEGKPKLQEICLCSHAHVHAGATCIDEDKCWSGGSQMSEEALAILRAAAAAEQYSTHPVAEAIVMAAREWKVDVPEALDQRVHPGLGVSANVDGKPVAIGQLRFIQQQVTPTDEFVEHTKLLQARGLTVALIASGGELAALGFQDSPRSGARDLVQDLRALGVGEIHMLTGDTEETARSVAAAVGVDTFRAGLMPDQKTEAIANLVDKGRSVMMVGDGINDAPSLARATVGVAMGGLGSDVALNSADVVLMHDKLSRIPDLINLGRRTNGIILANLVFATAVIATLTVTSLFFRLALPVAVIGHEGSTVIVILNGLRLLRGPRTD
ncbi:MAG: heavy metal translocating P-type ATPase, partial [Fimbriimonadales bacterium]